MLIVHVNYIMDELLIKQNYLATILSVICAWVTYQKAKGECRLSEEMDAKKYRAHRSPIEPQNKVLYMAAF